MTQLLIFGLSGQVGDALLPLLLESEFQITAVSRDEQSDEKNIVWQQSSLQDFKAPHEKYQVIISLGPLDAFSAWLDSANISADKIIALGSTSIVTKKNSPDGSERKLAQVLYDSEQLLVRHAEKNSAGLIILRPTLIYGFGRDQSLSLWVRMAKRFKFVVLPKSAGGLRQPVHAADVASAVFNSMRIEEKERYTLDLPGGETLAFDEMLLRTLDAHAPTTRILKIPDASFALLLKLASFFRLARGLNPGFFARLTEDWVFDASPARSALDYRPRAFSP